MKEHSQQVVQSAIRSLLREVIEGAGADLGWILNPGDPGLLASLDRISAAEASTPAPHASAPIAAHVDHLRYGLSLLNRTITGENPFLGADWNEAWRITSVSEADWARMRGELRAEAERWLTNSESVAAAGEAELTGVLASVAHLAYHLGAIRQLHPATRGPKATG